MTQSERQQIPCGAAPPSRPAGVPALVHSPHCKRTGPRKAGGVPPRVQWRTPCAPPAWVQAPIVMCPFGFTYAHMRSCFPTGADFFFANQPDCWVGGGVWVRRSTSRLNISLSMKDSVGVWLVDLVTTRPFSPRGFGTFPDFLCCFQIFWYLGGTEQYRVLFMRYRRGVDVPESLKYHSGPHCGKIPEYSDFF